jgi:polysaccharide export outer membrane protein
VPALPGMGLRRRSFAKACVYWAFDCVMKKRSFHIFAWFRGLVFVLLSMVWLSSCVTNKKYVYLQKDDVNVSDLPKDTVVRTYSLPEYNYRIQPHDALFIRFESLTPQEFDIFNQPGAGMGQVQNMINIQIIGHLVDPDGYIDYPVLGKIKVGGLTVFEAQEKIQKLADEFLESPVVRVRLINFRFTVLGEVRSEGTITTFNNRISVTEAIGLAGGLTDLADKRNVKLIRQNGNIVEIRYINLLDESFIGRPEYFIHQNDVLIVPALKQRPYHAYFGKNLSLTLSALSLLIITLTFINTIK